MAKLNDDISTPASPLPPVPVTVRDPSDISRRTIIDYFHMPGAGGRVFRLFSSREKMVEGMKTLAWVIPLTLLIWIYAVREQVVQPVTPNVNNVVVNFKSSDPNLFVEYAGANQPRVNLQLTGPQQSLELVHEQLTTVTAGLDLGLTIYVPSSLGTGTKQPINVADSIQGLDIFKNNGVTVQLTQPDTLYVNIDKKGRREMPILIPPTVANLGAESRFQPAKATVTGPETLLKKLDDGDLKVCAKLDGFEQLKQPGAHSINSVPLGFYSTDDRLQASAQETLRISPDLVNADLVVNASDVEYEITDAIPIWLNGLETTWAKYDVAMTNGDSIANIKVKGPQEGIDAIRNKTFTVKAHLDVDPSDANKDASRTLRYDLPEGVTVAPEDAAREVEFHMTRRE